MQHIREVIRSRPQKTGEMRLAPCGGGFPSATWRLVGTLGGTAVPAPGVRPSRGENRW